MPVKTINIPIEKLINMLKDLNDEAKDEIFEKVFIEEDTGPLSMEERESILRVEREFKEGATIKWPFGR